MLLTCWNDVVSRRSGRTAFWHPHAVEGVTFGQIDRRARELDVSGPFVAAVGDSLDFFPAIVAAWRAGRPVVLVENATSSVRPIGCPIPPQTVLIKQACGASGIERSLFFPAASVLAEGRRNIEGLGLHPDRRGLAAISLAHSYGFGCLALPLLLEGIPLDITAGPMPMFMHAGLDRGPGGGVFLPGVPAIWKTWQQTGVTRHRAIGLALSAGSPLSLELENTIHSEDGLKVHNFYGTSETGAIAYDGSSAPRSRAELVGQPLPGVEIGINQAQRLLITSDSQASAADVSLTPDEFSSGAYETLDQGELTTEGIFLSRCIGDAINVAGRKVSPFRLRGVLESLAGVHHATVERGESRDYERFEEIRVKLAVDPGYDKRVLREQLRQRVESWEMPRHWEFETVG